MHHYRILSPLIDYISSLVKLLQNFHWRKCEVLNLHSYIFYFKSVCHLDFQLYIPVVRNYGSTPGLAISCLCIVTLSADLNPIISTQNVRSVEPKSFQCKISLAINECIWTQRYKANGIRTSTSYRWDPLENAGIMRINSDRLVIVSHFKLQ